MAVWDLGREGSGPLDQAFQQSVEGSTDNFLLDTTRSISSKAQLVKQPKQPRRLPSLALFVSAIRLQSERLVVSPVAAAETSLPRFDLTKVSPMLCTSPAEEDSALHPRIAQEPDDVWCAASSCWTTSYPWGPAEIAAGRGPSAGSFDL